MMSKDVARIISAYDLNLLRSIHVPTTHHRGLSLSKMSPPSLNLILKTHSVRWMVCTFVSTLLLGTSSKLRTLW